VNPAVAAWDTVRDAFMRTVYRVLRLWRRSLRVRVVVATLVLSLVIVAILGAVLLNRITAGLLESKQTSALTEASAGFAEAETIVATSDAGPGPGAIQLVDEISESLVARAGTPRLYDVLLLVTPGTVDPSAAGIPPERGSNRVAESSVPPELRATVVATQGQAWTYSTIESTRGTSTPGIVVGAPLAVPGVADYELYYLFPLTQQQETLDLVTRTLALTGLALVVLLGGIAWLVTRQVVKPVRMAARIAEDFAAGRLEERMTVRGEDDFARLASAFNSMASSLKQQISQLEDLSRVQRRFVSDVSHELRTPLTTVRMAADMIHDARVGLDPAGARAAELLVGQLDRFEVLLTDLLEISRFDAGAAVLDVEQVDLRDAVAHVVQSTAPVAEANGTTVEVLQPSRPCVARVDPRRVERILRNLVVNAIEHGEGRPVQVRIAGDTLTVAVTVRDHGVGLRPGESALVFNRFWRADPARARTIGGTGLGLAIALEDARLHGGWLEAWGQPGDGSQFRLTLPVETGDEIASSPLPLRPDDADDRRRVPLSVGAPYRASAAPLGARHARTDKERENDDSDDRDSTRNPS
jgi:two-component system sensor histidine kinase MtrB